MPLISIILLAITTINIDFSTPATLPEYVQSLSDDNYRDWALWQNEQARLHIKSDWEPKYFYGIGVKFSNDFGRSSNNFGRNSNNFGRRNSSQSYETYQTQYINNNYIGPGPMTVLNPFCRFLSYEGTPNWNELFVYNNDEICTLMEAKIKLKSTLSFEELYRQLMSPYFK